METLFKKCSKCATVKSVDNYHKKGRTLRNMCKRCRSEDSSEYRKKNRKHILEMKKQYRLHNRDKISKYLAEYNRKRRNTDIQFKIAKNIRSRIYDALKGNFKSGSGVQDLGCSITDFQEYFISKFTGRMSWGNYGEWHIDHIVPLCSFDLTNREQFLKACHYTNLQPLWAEENLRKGGS